MTEDEFQPGDIRNEDAEMMAAFRALPFEERVLPTQQWISMNDQNEFQSGDAIIALDALDQEGQPVTYRGKPVRVMRVDGDEYPIRLTITLTAPAEYAGTPCLVVFRDPQGEEPAMLLHEKFHIWLHHD